MQRIPDEPSSEMNLTEIANALQTVLSLEKQYQGIEPCTGVETLRDLLLFIGYRVGQDNNYVSKQLLANIARSIELAYLVGKQDGKEQRDIESQFRED